ncbi:tripartite tricarboxylate transporter permease [Wansuia hejianensis]|uniref:Tripartite tricarboxylate transporter permease n=1 Tax=Wansuia hejianensis TaxID=2763667 RepID=A0A926IH02_9FIRM|nr:tripartite tricarboxylate transporter permease [Wansuia hejianensis]MBC8590127.1 tripartite tricarboxylate transporter permease [Wansuia hejianensis]
MIKEIFSIIDLNFIFLVFVGSIAGLFVGAMPGLSVTMATALLVSITFTWEVNSAMALIMGVYTVGVYSGAVTAILINIPGAPSSVATTLDGYPMAKKGDALLALKVAAFYSFIGTIIGLVVLGISAKEVAKLALAFTPMDYFLLSLFGLTTVGSLTSKNFTKGMISAMVGVFISMIGMDPIVGISRFTYGSVNLQRGISIIPALIGLFGFSEVLYQISLKKEKKEMLNVSREKNSLKDILGHWALSIRSSIIGVIIGALPGTGGPIAALLSYEHAKKSTKSPKVPFGEGAIEGIVASEAANNACIGGALIPMLTLAMPGDAVTAVILSAFYVHGLRPGPLLFTETPEMFSVILAGGFVGSIMILLLGLTVAPLLSKVVAIKERHLFPIVVVLCVIGSYAASTHIFDVFLMLIFGIVGYIMRRRDYAVAPMVLGLVLGGIMDSNFRRAMSLISASDNLLNDLFFRPITIILTILVIFSVVSNFISISSIKEKLKK